MKETLHEQLRGNAAEGANRELRSHAWLVAREENRRRRQTSRTRDASEERDTQHHHIAHGMSCAAHRAYDRAVERIATTPSNHARQRKKSAEGAECYGGERSVLAPLTAAQSRALRFVWRRGRRAGRVVHEVRTEELVDDGIRRGHGRHGTELGRLSAGMVG